LPSLQAGAMSLVDPGSQTQPLNQQSQRLRIGLIVNPVAGIGGSVGLRGSDGLGVQQEAVQRQGTPRGHQRLEQFLLRLQSALGRDLADIEWLTWGGVMGAQALADLDIPARVLGQPGVPSAGADTRAAVTALCDQSIDLLLFVGGDGTARDVLSAAPEHLCVLGLPAGVKMHSGVFAITPIAAAEVVLGLLQGGLVGRMSREVRDYAGDLQASAGKVTTQRFGDLWVPEAAGYLQQMKIGGKEDEGLVVQEIVSHVLDHQDAHDNKALVLGPGSTCLAIKQALGLEGSLLGVDVLLPTGEAMLDVTYAQLLALADKHAMQVLLSFTRHQGFLLGRGNQQLGPALLQKLSWPQDFTVLGSRTKLAGLDQRPLLVDTGDPVLDARSCGLISVLTGYEDFLLYRVDCTLSGESVV